MGSALDTSFMRTLLSGLREIWVPESTADVFEQSKLALVTALEGTPAMPLNDNPNSRPLLEMQLLNDLLAEYGTARAVRLETTLLYTIAANIIDLARAREGQVDAVCDRLAVLWIHQQQQLQEQDLLELATRVMELRVQQESG
eukprot:jgi/Chlat1/81/Chrsp1S03197